MTKTYYVYGLKNPFTGDIFYVGCSTRLKERYWSHLSMSDPRAPKKNAAIKAIFQLGGKPEIEVLDEMVTPHKKLIELLEACWILDLSTKFNLTNERLPRSAYNRGDHMEMTRDIKRFSDDLDGFEDFQFRKFCEVLDRMATLTFP